MIGSTQGNGKTELQNREKNIDDEEDSIERNTCALCPMKCGNIEHHQHYLRCTEITKTKMSKKAKIRISKWMNEAITKPTLERMIDIWIDDYMRELNMTRPDNDDDEMVRIYEGQEKIG